MRLLIYLLTTVPILKTNKHMVMSATNITRAGIKQTPQGLLFMTAFCIISAILDNR